MRSQTTERQLKTSVHTYRTVLGQAHHSVYTNLDQLACFMQTHVGNTSISSKKTFRSLLHLIKGFLVSAISSTICGTGIATYGVCQHPGSHGVSQHPSSYGPASRFIRQLTRWLCMPLFSSSANRCQHRPAEYNSSDLRVVHANSPEPWILATLKQRVFPVCFRK